MLCRSELESPKTANEMKLLIDQYLRADGLFAIPDRDYFSRKDSTVKTLIEEYEPLAAYLAEITVNCPPKGHLCPPGSHADGIIIWKTNNEKVQIVHGTDDYSAALKREALNNGKIVSENSKYERDPKTNEPVEVSEITSPRNLAKQYASKIISRIESKLQKGYYRIDTLLVSYNLPMCSTYEGVESIIEEVLGLWIKSKSQNDLKPFSRIVLVNNHQHVKFWDF
jgi:hypothetical protein